MTREQFSVRRPVLFVLAWQLLALALIAAMAALKNVTAAYSAALGALIFIIPNAYFSIYAFRSRQSNSTLLVSRSFSLGESGKLALAMLGFAWVFAVVKPLDVPLVFVGFCSLIFLQMFIARKIALDIERVGMNDDSRRATLNKTDKG